MNVLPNLDSFEWMCCCHCSTCCYSSSHKCSYSCRHLVTPLLPSEGAVEALLLQSQLVKLSGQKIGFFLKVVPGLLSEFEWSSEYNEGAWLTVPPSAGGAIRIISRFCLRRVKALNCADVDMLRTPRRCIFGSGFGRTLAWGTLESRVQGSTCIEAP